MAKEGKMPDGIIQFEPLWACLDCGETGDAKEYVPTNCPACGSDRIEGPPIKHGGPEDDNIDSGIDF